MQNIYLKNKYLFHRDTYAMDGEDTAIIKYVDGKGFEWSSINSPNNQESPFYIENLDA